VLGADTVVAVVRRDAAPRRKDAAEVAACLTLLSGQRSQGADPASP
jgi:predicted house-cleaning NTP pyrophosphatase (Maf/HAM1 superfamily)